MDEVLTVYEPSTLVLCIDSIGYMQMNFLQSFKGSIAQKFNIYHPEEKPILPDLVPHSFSFFLLPTDECHWNPEKYNEWGRKNHNYFRAVL